MKKFFAFTVLLLCMATFAQSQTTWTEYRYITNAEGLKKDKLGSGNIRGGYALTELSTSEGVTLEGVTRHAQVFSFKRQGGVTQAFVVRVWDSNNNFSFYCIPTATAANDIWDAAFKAISGSGKEWTMVFAWALAKTISQNL